ASPPPGRAPGRRRPGSSSGDGGSAGPARRPAHRSAASADPSARMAGARSPLSTSGPRGAYAKVIPAGPRFSSTGATPARRPSASRVNRRGIQPSPRFTSAHPADCRRCVRPVERTRSSQLVPSATGTGVARRVRLVRRARRRGRFLRLPRQLACRERAVGVALAAVEDRAAAAAAPDELALGAERADHAGLLHGLLDVLAIRVAGTADERTEAAALLRERLPAVGTDLALDDLGALLLAFERGRVIAATGRRGLALLALHEAGARVEAAVAAELDDDRPSALRADLVGRLLGDVRLLHRGGLLFHERLERHEEVADDRRPLDLAGRD